jgi:hypothetical protein
MGEGEWFTFDEIPTWKFIEFGFRSVEEQESDPEDTALVAMTRREVALAVFAIVYTCMGVRELTPHGQSLLDKLRELTDAQGFTTTGGSDEE